MDVARLAGISIGMMSMIENGKKDASAPTLARIAAVLGSTSEYLLYAERPVASQADAA